MNRLFLICVVCLSGLIFASATSAEQVDKSRVPPIAVYKSMLDANKQNGWVQFRDYNGKQWLYFTALQTLHCRLKEIRYSINSKQLDKTFNLVPCNPQTPFSMPSDFKPSDTLITFALGTVSTVALQVVWEDESESAVAVYEPCENVGDQSCAWPLE